MKRGFYLLLLMLVWVGCQTTPKKTASKEGATELASNNSMDKIDIHAHFQYSRNYFPDFFRKYNMQAVLVDVAKADSTGIIRSWNTYVETANAHPELFWLCSSLIGDGIDDPDYASKNIERLQGEIEAGAKMVKVWKNFGMVTKDASGKFIQIDDPRLQPIWDFLTERKIPVMAHIGEPRQAWLPLDDPNNPHYGYYSEHPEYHAFKLPEIPSYETIIAARDQWIANNPDLQILCAHFGSMSHDVDMIAERLDKFPNMFVESAARFGDMAGQNDEKVRTFFQTYQDRILFGTDFGNNNPSSKMTAEELAMEEKELDESYRKRLDYLSGADSVIIRNQKSAGLQLPDSVLKKVYYQNAVTLLGL